MANLTSVNLTAGVPTGPAGAGTVSTIDALMADGGQVTIGAKADTAVTATDTTPGSVVALLKGVISKLAGTLTVASHAVTNAGTFATQSTLQAGSAIAGKFSMVDSGGTDATDTTNHAIKVNVVAGGGSGGTSSTFGSSFPSTGTAVGFSDGTNLVAGTIKAASTAAAATDKAVVVAVSPNNFDFGSGTGGSHTLRHILDSSQVASSYSAAQVISAGAQLVTLPTDVSVPTKDAGPNWTTVWGVSGVPVTTATTYSTTAVTDAPTSGQKIVVDDIIVSTDAATKLSLLEETSGTVMFGPWYLPANSGPMQITVRGKRKLATADKKLVATSVGSANASVHVGYHSEA